ncbi:MAG: 16S rRNA (guanine(966)-N(2))-methyltransferase RsmD [Coprobacillaceae bacterium]
MRVIAGKYKSRQLKTPKSNATRPTTDRNKESMFNMIGPYFDGGIALDLFGGSGGLGIEALSRGCSTLYVVDQQYEAFKVIKDNLSTLQIDNATAWKMDYKKALIKLSKENIKLDLVLLDPPYGKQLVDDILLFLVEHQMLQQNCTIVIEELEEVTIKEPVGFHLYKRNSHGITAVSVYTYQIEE